MLVLLRLLALLATLASIGCNTIPEGRSAVNAVDVRGAKTIDAAEVEDKIATTPSARFLGIARGVVYEYSIFDPFVFQRDLARVEAFYKSKGYYDAHARAGRVHTLDDNHVTVEIEVEEGEPVRMRGFHYEGLEEVPPEISQQVERAVRRAMPPGKPFSEEGFTAIKQSARAALTDRGYAYATVLADAHIDVVNRVVDVTLDFTPEIPCVLGEVTIEGLHELPEAPVRRALDLKPGAAFSKKAVDDAQQAVLDLGVFASVDVTADLEGEPKVKVPIHVKVEPSRLRSVRLGVGIEANALASNVHGVIGWENRNLFGGLRSFAVTWRPGVAIYPLRVNNIVAPEQLMPMSRLRIELRQPGLFEPRTNGFIRPEFNVAPVFLSTDSDADRKVLGYAESKTQVGVDRTFWKLYGALSHTVQIAYPFSYRGDKADNLEIVTISYPELLIQLDMRNDRIRPRKGLYLANTLQFAGGPFGGQARDFKVLPEARGYIPLTRNLVFAARASVGLMYPSNYGDVVRNPPPANAPATASTNRDYQLTLFRGFFSGGPTQNRGYPLRGVGPHALVPAVSPESQVIESRCTGDADCRVPTGGFTLWEASMELRYDLSGPFSIASFCDASDVSPQVTNFRFDHLHLSCGAGARYDTPVGPIRLDVGYRIPGLQVLGGLTSDEKRPDTFFGDIPIAIAIGLGEAF